MALGENGDKNWDEMILPKYLNDDNAKHQEFVKRFISSRFYSMKESERQLWVDAMFKNKWRSEDLVEFATNLPFLQQVRTLIEQQTKTVQKAYWKSVQEMRQACDQAYSPPVVDNLLSVHRPLAAIEYTDYTLHYYETSGQSAEDEVDPERCKRALSASKKLSNNEKFDYQLMPYQIMKVIQFVQRNTTIPTMSC